MQYRVTSESKNRVGYKKVLPNDHIQYEIFGDVIPPGLTKKEFILTLVLEDPSDKPVDDTYFQDQCTNITSAEYEKYKGLFFDKYCSNRFVIDLSSKNKELITKEKLKEIFEEYDFYCTNDPIFTEPKKLTIEKYNDTVLSSNISDYKSPFQ